jgi:hypothetical protein
LPKAGAEDLKARLETFLADIESKYEHDLPGLKLFRKVAGGDKAARDLFVEMIKSPYNVELLQAIDKDSTEAGRAIADRRAMLWTNMQPRNVGGVIKQPHQVTLPDVACLLFAEAVTPSQAIPKGQFNYAAVNFIQQQASMMAINNPASTPHAEPYKKILGKWLETRDDVNDLNNLSYIAGQLLRGGKEEIPFLKSLLTNDTQVQVVFLGNQPNQQPIQHQCLVRDVALAYLITLTGQRMQDYGFTIQPGIVLNQQNIGYGNYAFTSDEKRAAAMVKFGFWQLKGSPSPNKPAPNEQPQPQPNEGPIRRRR